MGLTGDTNADVAVKPRNAYIPPGGFAYWNAAKAAALAGTGVANIMAFGASIAAGGSQVTDIVTKNYLARMYFMAVTAGWPLHGVSYLPTSSLGWNPTQTAAVMPATMNVTPLAWGFYGPFISPIWNTATTIPLMTYTHPSAQLGWNARAARFWYFDAGTQDGGSSITGRTSHVRVGVDAATDQLITAGGTHLIKYKEFLAMPNSVGNTIQFGNQGAASAACLPIAVSWYPTQAIPTIGVHWSFFGIPGGYTLADLIRTDQGYPAYRPERIIGPSNASVPLTADATLSPPWAPDLAILDLFDDISYSGRTGVAGNPNVTISGLAPDIYAGHGLRRATDALEQKSSGCNIVHHAPCLPGGLVSDTTPLAAYQLQNAQQYYMLTNTFAQFNGHGYLNTHKEWGQNAQALGFLPAGTDIDPHPTDAGQLDIANRMSSRLGLP